MTGCSVGHLSFFSSKVVGGSVMSDQAQLSVPCSICNQPLLIISRVKADETGQPVHEDCYLAKVQASDPKTGRKRHNGVGRLAGGA
jgi:hypothetical protein